MKAVIGLEIEKFIKRMASLVLSLIAIIISIIALLQSVFSYKTTIISNVKKELIDRANDCNKFIISDTQGHTIKNAEISAIVTSIINAKKQLGIFYKNHWLLLSTNDLNDFISFFYYQLHTSIIELIKNPLRISDYDINTSPKIEQQQLECRNLLQSMIESK